MAGKEAVVFILDSNHSMNAQYPRSPSSHHHQNSTISTRLSHAKDAILESIIDLAWRKKDNEVGVVVLKTRWTHHHLSPREDVSLDSDIGQLFFKNSENYFDNNNNADNVTKKEECSNNDFSNGDNIADDDSVEIMASSPPFPNLIELVNWGGINQPTPQLLNHIKSIQSTIPLRPSANRKNAEDTKTTATTTNPQENNNHKQSIIQGDFCDGIILAADALYRRTANKKFKRRIILVTDAEHEVQVNGEQLECVLGGLRKMECQLGVVGVGFESGGEFGGELLEEDDDDADKSNEDEDENDERDEVISVMDEDTDEDDVAIKCEEGEAEYNNEKLTDDIIKHENEKLLLSLAQQTGGWVVPANGENLTTLIMNHPSSSTAGLTKSGKNNVEFRIAPKLTLNVQSMLLTTAKKIPALKRESYLFDPESGKPLCDSLGELMTNPVKSITFHYDADEPELEVPLGNRTEAYQYGCDLIPVGKMDMYGLKSAFKSPRCIEMIGYVRCHDVPTSLLMGPAYAIVGGKDSNKSRAAVAGLALAMEEKGVYGLCRFVKTPDGDPVIGALIPKVDESGRSVGDQNTGDMTGEGARYLVFLRLPFAEDVQDIPPQKIPVDLYAVNQEADACDDLIDSLMIPDDEFNCTDISNPVLRSYQRMVAYFAMNPPIVDGEDFQKGQSTETILEAAGALPLCDFDVIKSLHEKASDKIDDFLEIFPLAKNLTGPDSKQQNKKYWGDGI